LRSLAFSAPIGVVTADADGQHCPADVLAVSEALRERPHDLILGVRHFSSSVPLRSRVGNAMTRGLMRLVAGQNLSDTQTGLRGIPRDLIPDLCEIPYCGYEFELEMLLVAGHQSRRTTEVVIRTIYLDRNRSSHFNPLTDSVRVWFTLLRFSATSMVTALVDNVLFLLLFPALGSIAQAMVVARTGAVLFNYAASREFIFRSQQTHGVVLPKYLALVGVSGSLSYSLIRIFSVKFRMDVVLAKIVAETLLFAFNFLVQRDVVFTRKAAKPMPQASVATVSDTTGCGTKAGEVRDGIVSTACPISARDEIQAGSK